MTPSGESLSPSATLFPANSADDVKSAPSKSPMSSEVKDTRNKKEEVAEKMRIKMSEAEVKRKKKTPTPNKLSSNKIKKLPSTKPVKKEDSTSESDSEDVEASFENYSELCERVAKTMYYSNPRQRCTPRPSLPLTILAVDTFSKYARKDTLEFLDIDMAAEIGRNACVSPTALVFAMVYLERLSANNPGYLKTIKPSELFVVSLLVASKFVQDDGEDLGIFNDEWATSANMELKKLNKLELEFLTAMDWRINVGNNEYDRALKVIEEKIAANEGLKRGWYTYTELTSLTNSVLGWDAVVPVVYERVLEVVSAISMIYTTFFATLISSSVLAPYLLSLSKLILMSSGGVDSLLATSPLTSCLQDLSLQNGTIPASSAGTTPTSNIQLYRSSGNLLRSLEDQENNTAENSIDNTHAWKQQLSNILSRHRRFYETANENYGYSFKCDHNCNQYSPEEPLANVQKVLENVLQSTNILNYKNAPLNDIIFGKALQPCVNNRRCIRPPVPRNIFGSKLIKV